MKKVLLLALLVSVSAPLEAQKPPVQSLTNNDVIKMVKAKLTESVIIVTIKSSRCEFDTSPDALISLKQAGVSDSVLQAMAESMTAPPLTPVSRSTGALLPTAFGYYISSNSEVQNLPPVEVEILIGLTSASGSSYAVDGLPGSGNPPVAVRTLKPTIIVYQQSGDVTSVHFKELVHVSTSMRASDFNIAHIAENLMRIEPISGRQLFRSVYGRDPDDTIPVDLWRPKEADIPFHVEPVEGKPGMYRLIPNSPLQAGRYTLYSGDAIHPNDWIFTTHAGRQVQAFYFSVSAGELAKTERPSAALPAVICGDYDSCFKSGVAFYKSGQWDQSLGYFQKASTLDPSKGDAWAGIGAVYFETARYDEAATMFDKALELGSTVSTDVCQQHLMDCDRGSLRISTKEVSFVGPYGQTLFSAAPSAITADVFTLKEAAYVAVRASGKNYSLFYIPEKIPCNFRQTHGLVSSKTVPECPEPGFTQQKLFADYVHRTIQKMAAGEFASKEQPPTPQPTAIPPDARHIAEQIRNEIASYERAYEFRSPLNDEQFLELIIGQAQQVGVPPWLLFGQARFETTFGDPINATTRDGVTFTDGSTGNAHNLFNIRPGVSWKGKVVETGQGGQFRVYGSYEDSVRDYLRLMSSDLYRGKTLEEVISTYFPASENGPAKVENYIDSVIQFASKLGFTVSKSTVAVP